MSIITFHWVCKPVRLRLSDVLATASCRRWTPGQQPVSAGPSTVPIIAPVMVSTGSDGGGSEFRHSAMLLAFPISDLNTNIENDYYP
jgi:hypothetical protein